ncbi:peptidoglycan recognition family protein [Streptosporangium sp. NPDC049644]|uniref:peptidoglycan recognition family protein n=1 Tax=Streptosporangium sp. NPDC049644 TaxID=3155507 RepID=UPI00341C2BA2
MRRLPGITVVTALAVLVSAVPAQAAYPGSRPTWPWKRPAPATAAASPGAVAGPSSSAGAGARSGRQAAFAKAARTYGVPESVLLAVSYLESRWEGHRGLPSVSAGYGPMHLVDGRARPGRPHGVGEDPRGDETRPRVIALPTTAAAPPRDTLRRASELTGLPLRRLREDPSANIMGGAALLADYRRRTGGSPDAGPAGWYGAVARYPGVPEEGAVGTEAARSFADEVYATIQAGAARVTDDGERVVLPATPGLPTPRAPLSEPPAPMAQRRAHGPTPTPTPEPVTDIVVKPATEPATKITTVLASAPSPLPTVMPAALAAAPAADPVAGSTAGSTAGPDCPRNVSCEWLPAVYRRLKDGGYGNHDRSDGPRKIDYIVIHDGETSYDAMTRLVRNPEYLSWHFTIRSSDGHIAQHLRARDIGWHAGNWYVNSRSIGLEHEGYLARGGSWFTEAMYRASARLVRHLAAKYDVPLDRAHILGHDNVPGTTPETVSGMHDDPGPYWDWSHYFELLGSPLRASGGDAARSVLIKPDYGTNSPNFTGCPGGCRGLGASSVWLHTRPSLTAPLVSDIGKHPTGDSTYSVYDHAARASSGQRYALAERRDGWTAIWYLGRKAWFSDPAEAPTSLPASGPLVTPRPGRAPIRVYGRAYPKAHAYPVGVPVQALTPLQYSIPAGQVYSSGPTTRASYLRAAAFDPAEHRVVRGETRYRQIQFGHRIMFVRASDVQPAGR